MPPPSYPSASPYYSLTKYFARLVKKKVITRQMLRKLLHDRPWAKAFELSGMPVRRRQTNRVKLRVQSDGTVETENESDSENSDTELDQESNTSSHCTDAYADDAPKIIRQDAMDTGSPRTVSSSGSSWGPHFGYGRYEDDSKDSNVECELRLVKADCTKEIFQSLGKDRQILDDNNNRYQYADSNAGSSFEYNDGNIYMACEDLQNLDQNKPIENNYVETDFLPIRRSFAGYSAKNNAPMKLWKSSEEQYNKELSNYEDIVTPEVLKHLDPPPLVAPRASFAGSVILDPPPMFRNDDVRLKVLNLNLNTDIPFRKHYLNSDKKIRRSMSKSMVDAESFRNYNEVEERRSTSSENNKRNTKKCTCCNRSVCHSPRSSDSGVVGSCNLATPELNIHDPADNGRDTDPHDKPFYSIKEVSCFGLEHRKSLTLSEIEAATYEDQCRCTSPFGSTARTSCVTSVTSENISLDVFDTTSSPVTSTYVATPPVTSPQIQRTSIRRHIEKYVPEIKVKPDPPPRLYRQPSTHIEMPKNVRQPAPPQWSTLDIKERNKPSLHYHMRIFRDANEKNTERKSRMDIPRNNDKSNKKVGNDDCPRKLRSKSEDLSKLQKGSTIGNSGFMVYRSDLYAHWWMKAKLPITVVNDSGKDSIS